MLVLTRRRNESVVIGDGVTVTVLEIRCDRVRLGIACPREVSVHRQEIWAPIGGAPPAESPAVAVSIDPAWLEWKEGTVPRLARAIHDDRAWDRLPILADALEEAGCTDAAVLGHCRSGTAHSDGCWLVDEILGLG
jgi:carbon storage regulator CsrA